MKRYLLPLLSFSFFALVRAAHALPDLVPYAPDASVSSNGQAWSAPIVIAKTNDTFTDSTGLTTADDLWFSYAVANVGDAATPTAFEIWLYQDGVQTLKFGSNGPLQAGHYTSYEHYNLGKMPAGTHTLKIVADGGNVVTESNKTNNEYTKTITVTGGNTTPPTDYDVEADFSIKNGNPNGAWTYGYSSTLTSPLTKYQVGRPAYDGVDEWIDPNNNNSDVPRVAHNATNAATTHVPANAADFHPGCNGEFSHYVWTAPMNGAVSLSVLFSPDDSGGTDVHISKNGTSLFSGAVSPGNSPSFTQTLNVVTGDTLDFAVGVGADGNCYSDSTGIAAHISYAAAAVATVTVSGMCDPYLADGIPAKGDTVGDPPNGESPKVVPISFSAGQVLTFSAIGQTDYNGGPTDPNADAADGSGFYSETPDNGISGCGYPLNSLVGVFTDDNKPTSSSVAPPSLDFSGSAGGVPGGVDYTQLSPQLRQVFFIGNGTTSSGVRQRITVPHGATHLYLASTDGSGWYNNSGHFTVVVSNGAPFPNGASEPYKWTTLAGLAGSADYVDGKGSAARFRNPAGTAVDADGNVYVADLQNGLIRKVTPTGVVSTLAGNGYSGSDDGTGNAASFSGPSGVAVGRSGNVYVADSQNDEIRKVTPAGVVTTVAGKAGVAGSADGSAPDARFNTPAAVAVDAFDNIFVADTGNQTVRKIGRDGKVSTIAGSPGVAGSKDGVGAAASFQDPRGIAVDFSGTIFVADTGNQTIRRISPDGTVSTVAGSLGNPGFADGTGAAAHFNYPHGVAVDRSGSIYVADSNNDAVRKMSSDGLVTTLGGKSGSYGSTDGIGSEARFSSPSGLAVDKTGKIYVADFDNHTIRTGVDATVPVVLFNTGVRDNGERLSDGVLDEHWSFHRPDTTTFSRAHVRYYPTWIAAPFDSSWISSDDTAQDSVGSFTYQTTFDLTGVDPNLVRIKGKVAADDTVSSMLVNGSATGVTLNGPVGYDKYSTFTIDRTANLQPGLNTITIVVTNASGGATGLNVEFTSGTKIGDRSSGPVDLRFGQNANSTVSPNGSNAIAGERISYNLTIYNAGTSPASNVVVFDRLPPLTHFLAASGGGFINSAGVVEFDLGTVLPSGPDGAKILTIDARVDQTIPPGNVLSNKPFAVADGIPYVECRDKVDTTITAPLDVQTTTSSSTVDLGGKITYSFVVSNHYPSGTSNVHLFVPLPLSVQLVSAKVVGTGADGSVNGQNVEFSLGDLAAGASQTVTVTVQLPFDSKPDGSIVLGAVKVTSDTNSGAVSFNLPPVTTALSGRTATNAPVLGLSKFVPDGTTIKMLYLEAALTGNQPILDFFQKTFPGLSSGDQIDALGRIVNPDVSDNTDASGNFQQGVIAPGQPNGAAQTFIRYALLYSNTGGGAAENATIQDRVPEGTAYDDVNFPEQCSATIDGNAVTAGQVSFSDYKRTLNFNLGTLSPGYHLITYGVRVLARDEACGPDSPQCGLLPGGVVRARGAFLRSTSLFHDATGSPAETDVVLVAPGNGFIESYKRTPNGAVGDVVDYDIFYQNTGGLPAGDFQIVDAIPAGTSYVGAGMLDLNHQVRALDGSRNERIEDVTVGSTSGTVTYHLGPVPPGEFGFVRFSVKVEQSALQNNGLTYTNKPGLAASSFPQSRAAHHAMERTTESNVPLVDASSLLGGGLNISRLLDRNTPRVGIGVIAPLSVREGSTFDYLIFVANPTDSFLDAAGVVVPIPPGAEAVDAAAADDPNHQIQVSLNGYDNGIPAVRFFGSGVDGLGQKFDVKVPPHGAILRQITFRAKTGSAGSNLVCSNVHTAGGKAGSGGSEVATVYSGAISTYVYGLDQSFDSARIQIVGSALATKGATTESLSSRPDFQTSVNALTPTSTTTVAGGLDNLSLNNGDLVIPLGNGNVLAAGPSNGLVAAGGGNVVSHDGGSLVAAGGGNVINVTNLVGNSGGTLITNDGASIASILSNLVAAGGGNLVAAGGGNLVAAGGGNLITNDGGSLITNDGGSLVRLDASKLISQDGGGIVAAGAGNLVAAGGGNLAARLVAAGGGNIVAAGGGNIVAAGGGNIVAAGGGNVISNDGGSLVAAGGGNIVAAGGGNLVAAGGGNFHPGSSATSVTSLRSASPGKKTSQGTRVGDPKRQVPVQADKPERDLNTPQRFDPARASSAGPEEE